MLYDYYDYYTTPIINYVDYSLILGIAAVIAVILGVVLWRTFLKKSNEGKFTGFKGKLYNLLVFNRFYAENIIKFVYILAACVVTVMGIALIVMGSFVAGIMMLVVTNLVLRISVELVLMFIMLCKKTVSVDRRLSKIEDFYVENYGDDWGDESCSGDCGSCGGCDDMYEDDEMDEVEEEVSVDCEFDRKGCSGCDGYSECSATADADCGKCGSWSAMEGLCLCNEDCESCEKKDEPVAEEQL